MQTERSGAPRQESAAEQVTTTEVQATARHRPSASARLYPPYGKRHQWTALVRCCPWCEHAHLHRGEAWHELAGEVRTGSCGRSYRLEPCHIDLRGGAA